MGSTSRSVRRPSVLLDTTSSSQGARRRGRTTATRRRNNRSAHQAEREDSPPGNVGAPSAPSVHTSLATGDHVVCPPHGVVQVVGKEAYTIHGRHEVLLVLRTVDRRLRILLPENRARAPHLRPIATAREAEAALRSLRKRRPTIVAATWSKRQKACLALLSHGSLAAIADVLRDLRRAKRHKRLSIAESRLLETAQSQFVCEASLATGRTEQQILTTLDACLGK